MFHIRLSPPVCARPKALLRPLARTLLLGLALAGCAAPPHSSPLAPALARAADTAEAADAGELVIRPPVALTAPQRARLAQIVQTDPSAAALWKPIEAQAQTILNQTPAPLAKISYEGRLNTDAARIETVAHLHDMDDLSVLGYAYAATTGAEQQGYAAKMRAYVLAWAKAYQPTGNPINENKLEPVWVAYRALQEGETFSPAEKTRVESWLRQIGEAELEFAREKPATTQNNWHTKRLKMLAQIGAILGEPKFTDYVARDVKRYVADNLRPDGTSEDLEQRDALSYHVAGLVPFLILARELEPTGLNLYRYQAPTGASLQKSVEFVAPYARGEREYPQWRHTTVELDRARARAGIAEYQPGVLWKPAGGLQLFEQAAYFDARWLPLVQKLAGQTDDRARYATWNMVLLSAMAPAR